jgi:hypothetical protein
MPTEWTGFWLDAHNLRWSVVDEVTFEKVASILGWGPTRSLLEIGAGRGLLSKRLYETMRADWPDLYDPCPESYEYMTRAGLRAVKSEAELRNSYDVVWSNGLVEHFEGDERQGILGKHFRRSGDWVVIVTPRRTLRRSVFRPHASIPHQIEYTEEEMRRRLGAAALECWGQPAALIGVETFCPLFGIRHIPDAWYPVVDKLAGWALPDGLIVGWARRAAVNASVGGPKAAATT